MTFKTKHPFLNELIDELIQAARVEATSRIAAQLSPIRPVVAEARKREVAARKARKALVDQIKLSLHRD